MKTINFINPINPQHEYTGTIWFRCTVAIVLMTIAIITYIQCIQISTWYTYRQEYKKYLALTKQQANITEEKKKQTEQEEKLKNKSLLINNKHNQCNTYIAQLNALQVVCANTVHFISCALTPRGTEITISCDTIEQAQECCNILNKGIQTNKMNIASIIPKKHVLQVTFKN